MENILPPEMVPDAYRKAAGAVVLGDEVYFYPLPWETECRARTARWRRQFPHPPVNIENLGSLTIHKTDEKGAPSGCTFYHCGRGAGWKRRNQKI